MWIGSQIYKQKNIWISISYKNIDFCGSIIKREIASNLDVFKLKIM